MFKMMSGAEMVHVPYRGMALALQDLLVGQVQIVIGSIPFRRRARPRLRQQPMVWHRGPLEDPIEMVDKLNKEINATLADPKNKAHFATLGGMALAGSPASFTTLIAEETEKWAKVVKFAGIKTQ